MTAQMIIDQVRGRKNVVQSGNFKLGETGFVFDRTKTGQNVYMNSGNLVEVMIVQCTSALSSPAGLGVVFSSGNLGTGVGAFSTAAGLICDGIVDPELSGNLAVGDTFLLFRKGPMNVVASAAITANAPIKPANGGKFGPATTESVPNRVGRANVLASADGDIIRAWVDFTTA